MWHNLAPERNLFLSVGSSNGLSLILNIEQYEYMKGPQTDAGVKVSMPGQWHYARVKVSIPDSRSECQGQGQYGRVKVGMPGSVHHAKLKFSMPAQGQHGGAKLNMLGSTSVCQGQ